MFFNLAARVEMHAEGGGHLRHLCVGLGTGGSAQKLPTVGKSGGSLLPRVYGVSDRATHRQLPALAGGSSRHGSHLLCKRRGWIPVACQSAPHSYGADAGIGLEARGTAVFGL